MADGICVAFGQNAYATSPTWTRIDDPAFAGLTNKATSPWSGRFVQSWRSDRGRSYEMDKTQAGTATITALDTTGYFDPTNPSSPLYGKINPMLRARINMQNPASKAYGDMFTGFLESWNWTMTSDEKLMTVTIGLVDGFEPLARGELQVGANGTTILSATSDVQTFMDAILDLAGWPNPGGSEWRNLNTGNVFIQRTIYNPQASFLSCLQDGADAEFPGVANVFVNKSGAVTFYGRYPRFQPTNYPQDVTFWQAGDASGADAFGAARIKEIEWELDSKNLINAALCYPYGIEQTDIAGQLVTNAASIAKYGIRTHSLPDLINDGQPASGNPIKSQPALAKNPATKLFATYYAQNYAEPALRISKLTFGTRNPGDSQTWALMCGVEIGDIITVYTRNPGGGGFSKETDGHVLSQFFVEGIHNEVHPLTDQVVDMTVSLDVSPRTWFPANYPIGGT